MNVKPNRRRPLLGLRKQPGRLALAAMRVPRPLYRHRLGALLGHTFLLITHQGRNTGKPHETVVMTLGWSPETKEAIACSVWGETQWVRNLRVHPARKIEIGSDRFTPEQRFLDDDEAVAAVTAFRERHPRRVRFFSAILGWNDLDSDDALRKFVANRPFIAFRPTATSTLTRPRSRVGS